MKKVLFLVMVSLFAWAAPEHSLLKETKSPYIEYINVLIKEQNVSINSIKEVLAQKNKTIKGSILKGLHYQYSVKDFESAKYYYDSVLKKVPHLVKNTTNALFLADFLVYEDRFDEINRVLDSNYCNTLLSDKSGHCAYYSYLGKKSLGLDYWEELLIINKEENKNIKAKLVELGEL